MKNEVRVTAGKRSPSVPCGVVLGYASRRLCFDFSWIDCLIQPAFLYLDAEIWWAHLWQPEAITENCLLLLCLVGTESSRNPAQQSLCMSKVLLGELVEGTILSYLAKSSSEVCLHGCYL